MTRDPNQLVTLTTATSEFGANATVAVLADAGIEAFTFGSTGTALGIMGQTSQPGFGAPVQVRRCDYEAARTILMDNRRDSVDIDWDQVELGQREDDLPLHEPGRVPLPASMALWVAIGLVILGFIGAALYVTLAA